MAGREVYYIAGPQGAPTPEERMLFAQRAAYVAKEVWFLGHGAICPHLNTYEFGQGELGYADFLPADFEMIWRSDGIIMLPGWGDSKGACAEYWFALWSGTPVWFYPDLPEVA